ncbi:hypothetical protein ACGF4C_18445 [Streptomyces sp. NPDC048197]|uniref:hypothetical protein n=1 Tax=Streptomyces sp. NPDC048197 TaxID=3365511 RepID=UPI0037138D7F
MQLRRKSGSDTQPIPAESKESKLTTWLNTSSTLLTAVIAIPALVISLITYFDAKSDTEENDEKEAARISWYFQSTPDLKKPDKIVVENRSLRPVYDFILQRDHGHQSAILYVDGTVSPCSRIIYSVRGHEQEVAGTDSGYALFRDSLNSWWWSGYEKGLGKFEGTVDTSAYSDYVIASKWGIRPKYEELDGCG